MVESQGGILEGIGMLVAVLLLGLSRYIFEERVRPPIPDEVFLNDDVNDVQFFPRF